MPRAARLENGLTLKEEAFCQAFVKNGGNATAAYRSAYRAERMKRETVNKRAQELLNTGVIAGRIAALREKVAAKLVFDEARVLTEIARLALADARDIFTANGALRPISEWPADVAAAVASVETGPSGVTKVKLWPKNPALEMLCKHLGLFEQDNAQKANALRGLPRELVKQIYDHLKGLENDRPGLAEQPAGGSTPRVVN